jgi:ADP-ribosyl-[dinitrogen reductase] hydrolase
MDKLNRYRGSLLGLAAGDALGTTLEFRSPGSFMPIEDIVGGGPFGLRPGEWTDDTSMALCLAESLIECRGFDPVDQLRRYVRWYREGHLCSRGRCFDIGATVSSALRRFEASGEPYCGSTDEYSAGNGSIMRLAPVPLFFAHDPREAIARSAESSRTTHGAAEAVDACRYLAALIVGALNGVPKAELLSNHFAPVAGLWDEEPLSPRIAAIASGSYSDEFVEIRGTGYVVRSLEAALWAFDRSTSFREGALLAVNLGDDADTTGAVYGQLAGAFYGEDGIPSEWRECLAMGNLIASMAEGLHSAAHPEAREPAKENPEPRRFSG